MSSWPGPTLEDFVDDAWFHTAPLDDIKKALEPMRRKVEDMLDYYIEEGGDAEHSWRDWRNAWFSNHEEEINALLKAAGVKA